jgi:O-antigen ligase
MASSLATNGSRRGCNRPQTRLEDDNLPVLECAASSTPLSFSQQALAMLTGFLMTVPLWTHNMIGAGMSADDRYLYVMTLLVLVFPILAFSRKAKIDRILVQGAVKFLLIFIGSLIISIVINFTNYSYIELMTCAVRMTALILFVALIVMIEMNAQARPVLSLVLLAASCSLALLFVFASVVTPVWYWGRFAPNEMQPNWWGEVLFVVVFGGAFTSKMMLRYGLWALALVGLVLVQSRGNLLAALLLMTVVTLAGMRSRTVIAIAVACTIAVTLDVFVLETRLSSAAQDFVADDVLLLNDPYRGFGTGMAGRDTNVAFGLELFVEHPLAGVGFGRSPRLADEAVGASIHNAYVALLAELGAPLFAILAIIMIGAVWLSVARKHWEILGMIVSFMVVFFMVNARAINMSLPTMLFWAFVARSWILPLRP